MPGGIHASFGGRYMNRIPGLLALLTLTVVLVAATGAATAADGAWDIDIPHEKFVLDNGLTLAETTLFRFEDLNRGVL